MFEKIDHSVFLLNKYFSRDLTLKQSGELEAWLSESEGNRKLLVQFGNGNIMEEKVNLYLDSEIPNIWTRVQQRINGVEPGLIKEMMPSSKTGWKAVIASIRVFMERMVPTFKCGHGRAGSSD